MGSINEKNWGQNSRDTAPLKYTDFYHTDFHFTKKLISMDTNFYHEDTDFLFNIFITKIHILIVNISISYISDCYKKAFGFFSNL